jgi:hypothetical protein
VFDGVIDGVGLELGVTVLVGVGVGVTVLVGVIVGVGVGVGETHEVTSNVSNKLTPLVPGY